MRADEIEKLIVRYDKGETSEMEEQELFRFFSEEDVPAHLQADKAYFMQLKQMQEVELPPNLEARLGAAIDGWEAKEKQANRIKKTARFIRWQWISGIAAGLFILFGFGAYLYERHTVPAQKDTCNTPEEAYQETRKALVLFSSTLNKGLKKMETISQTTEKMQESVNEQLNQIKIVKQ